MISRTKIKKGLSKKTDPEIVETIKLAMGAAKKNLEWGKIAKVLSGPRKNYSRVNVGQIDRSSKEGDTVIVPGKVLSSGSISKRVKVCVLSFSELAVKKILKTKSEYVMLSEEISKNPNADGIKIIK